MDTSEEPSGGEDDTSLWVVGQHTPPPGLPDPQTEEGNLPLAWPQGFPTSGPGALWAVTNPKTQPVPELCSTSSLPHKCQHWGQMETLGRLVGGSVYNTSGQGQKLYPTNCSMPLGNTQLDSERPRGWAQEA